MLFIHSFISVAAQSFQTSTSALAYLLSAYWLQDGQQKDLCLWWLSSTAFPPQDEQSNSWMWIHLQIHISWTGFTLCWGKSWRSTWLSYGVVTCVCACWWSSALLSVVKVFNIREHGNSVTLIRAVTTGQSSRLFNVTAVFSFWRF